MLFNIRWIGLKFSTVAAGIIVLFFCRPLWGDIVDFHHQPPAVSVQKDFKIQTTDDRLIWLHGGYFAKRRSSNQHFQQWQDLSPKEQEKMRKKYKEWQSLPPQKRKLYKQLFRQWQHLSPKERKQLQKDLDNWENLSPKQRNSIRRRFKN